MEFLSALLTIALRLLEAVKLRVVGNCRVLQVVEMEGTDGNERLESGEPIIRLTVFRLAKI